MKKISSFLCALASLSICSTTFSQTQTECKQIIETVSPPKTWYLVGGGGYSMPNRVDISANPLVWDASNQGYSDDLNSSALLFFGVGDTVCNGLRLDVRAERQGDYRYSKFQTGISNTSGFTGAERVRKFKLVGNSLMFNGWLDLGSWTPFLLWQTKAFSLQPFVGGGLGMDYLNVRDFHTIGPVTGVAERGVGSVNQSSTGLRFAWHVGAGLEARITERSTVAVGYRYFDAGHIPFPAYVVAASTQSGDYTAAEAIPWRGNFSTNEVYLEWRLDI